MSRVLYQTGKNHMFSQNILIKRKNKKRQEMISLSGLFSFSSTILLISYCYSKIDLGN